MLCAHVLPWHKHHSIHVLHATILSSSPQHNAYIPTPTAKTHSQTCPSTTPTPPTTHCHLADNYFIVLPVTHLQTHIFQYIHTIFSHYFSDPHQTPHNLSQHTITTPIQSLPRTPLPSQCGHSVLLHWSLPLTLNYSLPYYAICHTPPTPQSNSQQPTPTNAYHTTPLHFSTFTLHSCIAHLTKAHSH